MLILVNGRVAESVPAVEGGPFSVDLSGADVRDGGLTIGLRTDLDPDRDCFRDDQAVASLDNAALVLERRPKAPTTVAGFLDAGSSSFVVSIPGSPTPTEQAAGLDAMLALRHISGPSTTLELLATDVPPPTTAESRTVVVDATDDAENALTVTDGRLWVTGADEGLAAAAVSIADPNNALLDVTSVSGLSGQADYAPLTGTASLQDLGISALRVSGVGRVSQTVEIPQAAFGSPVSQLIVELRAAATPVVPGQQARVNINWNDRLVASQALSQDSRLALDFTAGAEDLRSLNYLEVELEYLPAGGDCSDPPLSGEVQLDVAASQVTPTFGTSVGPGFQRFPQSFGPAIPVTAGAASQDDLANLGGLLDAAVRVSPLQYTVEVVDASTLAENGGVGTGIAGQQADELGAPLPDEQDSAGFPPGRTTPYAALQAFQSGGSDLVLLSAAPEQEAATLAAWPGTQAGGWSSLTGQVYVLGQDSPAPEPFAAKSTAPDKRTPQIIAAAVATLLLGVFLLIWLRRRPARD